MTDNFDPMADFMKDKRMMELMLDTDWFHTWCRFIMYEYSYFKDEEEEYQEEMNPIPVKLVRVFNASPGYINTYVLADVIFDDGTRHCVDIHICDDPGSFEEPPSLEIYCDFVDYPEEEVK